MLSEIKKVWFSIRRPWEIDLIGPKKWEFFNKYGSGSTEFKLSRLGFRLFLIGDKIE